MLTLLSLLCPAAHAAEPVPVLVSAFQPRTPEAKKLATLVEGYLAEQIGETDGLRLVRVEDTPKFTDYDARIYIDSCPPMQIVGCSLIVAERGETLWAVTGSVQARPSGSKVEVSIINVEESRVAVSFASEVQPGNDQAFAEGVAKVLVAAIRGEVGKEEDIREDEDGEPRRSTEENAQVAKELEALERELGDITSSLSRDAEEIERPTYTVDDIAEQMQSDATKPWEAVGMGPSEYLQYKNSGISLYEWRKKALGRKGQLMLRLGGGLLFGPVNATWYGRYRLNSTTLAVEDAYAAQSPETAAGAIFGGGLAVGITPSLEIGVAGGVTSGSFMARIGDPEKEGDVASFREIPDDNWSYWASLRFGIAPFPTWRARPMIAIGGTYLKGSGIHDHVDIAGSPTGNLDPDQTIFAGANLIAGELTLGGEVSVSDNVDIYLHVPLDLWLVGTGVVSSRNGTGELLENLDPPVGAAMFGAGVQAGLQVRLFGAKPRESSALDDLEEIIED